MQQNDRDDKLEEEEKKRKFGRAVQDCFVTVMILNHKTTVQEPRNPHKYHLESGSVGLIAKEQDVNLQLRRQTCKK